MPTTILYEVVAGCTLSRGSERITLVRGAKLKIDPEHHGFSERELQRAIRERKLRALPLGLDDR